MGDQIFFRFNFELEPRLGDIIEILRNGGYSHFVIYVGNDYVVHVCGNGKKGNRSKIKKELLDDVTGVDMCRINNRKTAATLKHLSSFSRDEIVRRAEAAVGDDWDYDVMKWNCEHFATWIVYGDAFRQYFETIFYPNGKRQMSK
jgi:hypothetical protein